MNKLEQSILIDARKGGEDNNVRARPQGDNASSNTINTNTSAITSAAGAINKSSDVHVLVYFFHVTRKFLRQGARQGAIC